MYLFLEFLLRVAEEHEGKVMVAAMDGAIQEKTDHATERCIYNNLGIDIASGGGVGK